MLYKWLFPNKHIYNEFVNNISLERRLQDASKALEDMVDHGMVPNYITYKLWDIMLTSISLHMGIWTRTIGYSADAPFSKSAAKLGNLNWSTDLVFLMWIHRHPIANTSLSADWIRDNTMQMLANA